MLKRLIGVCTILSDVIHAHNVFVAMPLRCHAEPSLDISKFEGISLR